MIVVTAGSAYLDIDAYAGKIGYAELLKAKGEEAVATSKAPLNESITKKFRKFAVGLDSYSASEEDTFVLVDVSDKQYFDEMVDLNRVSEVIDHRRGFEDYWKSILGEKAQIEAVGSACTQVYERWETSRMLDSLNPEVAQLLAAGILDNTLNFKAGVTTDRDRNAYGRLLEIAGLSDSFAGEYFSDCQEAIEADIEKALRNDTKEFASFPKMPRHLGQLVVWDGEKIIGSKLPVLIKVMNEHGEDWAINLVSIKDGKSYFLAEHQAGKQKIQELVPVKFENDISESCPMMLRKEILKRAIDG